MLRSQDIFSIYFDSYYDLNKIVDISLTYLEHVTLIFLADRLYWTDLLTNRFESSDLNGGHHLVLSYDDGALLNDIIVHGRYLFYTAWQRQ